MTFSTQKVKRLAATALLIFFMFLDVRGYAQVFNLDVKDTPLGKALQLIQKRTGYNFFYFKEDVDLYRTSFSVKNASIEQVLSACLRDLPVSYSIENNIVSIKKGEPVESAQPGGQMINVSGRISNENGDPLPGANIIVQGTNRTTTANENGDFKMNGVNANAVLVVSYIGYSGQNISLRGKTKMNIVLRRLVTEVQDLKINYSDGYQTIPKERATGSFVYVDNTLFNRSVSTDVLSRLSDVVSGLIFEKAQGDVSGNSLGLTIRGLSTINANTQPLIVIDNFPYDGDLNNINPNDVESVTVLKDAAAASIWGVRAGNGVVVITTKKGAYNQSAHLSFNTNLTITGKPNLFYAPTMSSSDYIDMETYLYNQGFYDNAINSNNATALDPVQEILVAQTNGQISAAQATAQINAYRKLDIRNDAKKYLYQGDINQQYALSVSGGGQYNQYYLSAGMDNNSGNGTYLKRNSYRRISVDASNVYSFFDHHFDISTSIYYINSMTQSDGMSTPSMPVSYPYAQLADGKGNHLPIAQYRTDYIDTAGQGMLLNWDYVPLDELANNDNTSIENEYRVDVGLKYKLPIHLNAEVKYQYGNIQSNGRSLQGLQTFYTRNLINSFTEINWATGTVTYPVPVGGILRTSNNSFTYQNFRAQLSYSGSWNNNRHQLTAIAGTEIRDANNQAFTTTIYGYDDTHLTSVPVDEANLYPNYITSSVSTIPYGQYISSTTNRYLSYFGNAAFVYLGRYTLSISGRNDGSNLFGVNTNQKHVPLWSTGLSWNLSREQFYRSAWLPYFKFRATYGYQGNLSNVLSALLTTEYVSNNYFGAPQEIIANPPNPNLRWEKVAQTNFAIDFSTKGDHLSGSIEYYFKKGSDLIGTTPLAPSAGMSAFTGNTANMGGKGVDLVLNSRNFIGLLHWSTVFLLSYNTDRVTKYGVLPLSNGSFVSVGGITPLVGKPVHAIYAYKWAGLDSIGNPQGYLNGKSSEDYSSMENIIDISQLKYMGHAAPLFFGSIRNDFSCKQFAVSFNITYRFDYYFRRPSVNYYNLFNYGYNYGTDYAKRWQVPGDEAKTNVPSLSYPINSSIRDQFYAGSEVLIDRGDEIRLQDIRISYDLNRRQLGRLPVQGVSIYIYANNIGLLWRANHDGIDPDAVPPSGSYSSFPSPRSFSGGVKVNL